MKVWSGSSAEPAAWQVTATDNGASLQVPGSVGLMAYMSRSVTNGPVVLRMSALTAQPTA
jgi:hypothetical protein